MKKLLIALLFIPTLAFGQVRDEDQCKVDEDYWSESKTACFESDDFDNVQHLLFVEYNRLRLEQFRLVHLQSEFTPEEAATRLANFNARIAALEIRRDASVGRAAEFLQEKIDKSIRRRDELDSTEPGGPRYKADNAGPQIAEFALQAQEVADSLDTTFN